MSKAKQIIKLEEQIFSMKRQLVTAKERLQNLKNGHNTYTTAHCQQIINETPNSTILMDSWREIYSADDSRNSEELEEAIKAHCQLFGRGFAKGAEQRVREILAKRKAA